MDRSLERRTDSPGHPVSRWRSLTGRTPMYFLPREIKDDPAGRWALPDRIFLGHGACHILAGVYLSAFPACGFRPVWSVEWLS